MGPKHKKKLVSEVNHEKKSILVREKQRQRRARLIGGKEDGEAEAIGKELKLGKGSQRRGQPRLTGDQNLSLRVSDVVSLGGSPSTFQETPEENSVNVDINEDGHKITQEEKLESEILPGPKGQLLYYDGVGYYYNQLYEDINIRWLQCIHADCSTLGQMKKQERAPIRLVEGSSQHEHPPNPARRDHILFLHTVKTRHANEHTPFSVIFQQESYKNPVGASFFSFDKIQAHLQKKIMDGSENLSQESVLSAARTLSMMTVDRPSPVAGTVGKKRKTEEYLPPSKKLTKKLKKSLKNTSFTECETSEEPATSLPSKPSERLPGPHLHSYIYHDGHGYFYKPLSIAGGTRYLQCNSAGCHAQAVMALEECAPISLESNSSAHNHPPENPKMSPAQPASARPFKTKLSESQKKENKITIEEEENLESKNKVQSPKISPARPKLAHSFKIKLSGGQKKEKKKTIEQWENQETKRKTQTEKVVSNTIPKVSTRKQSERIQGPEYYYDFKGHYYFATRWNDNKRYLRCLFPNCIAEAVMTLEDNAEIQPMSGSRPHNHQPVLTTKYHTQIKQWEEQWAECLPSERLPSLRVQYCCYHDGRGYYYHQTNQSDNIRYLTCSEPKCPVRAHMGTQKDAPITLSGLKPSHTHGPDHTLRDALLFIDAVRVRARSDTDTGAAIAIETARNPVGAERVDLQPLEICLEKAAKIANGESNEGIMEDEVDFISCLKPKNSVNLKPSTESQVPVSNHFTSPRPMLDDHQSKTEEGSLAKSEFVPSLTSDSWLYHDGCGYYYSTKNFNYSNRKLQCVSPKCGAQALVGQVGAPVKLQSPHNHGSQPPQYCAELWFFHRIKTKAQRNPDIPLEQIYKEVAEKDPDGAALISEVEMLQLMDKYLISIIQGNSSRTLSINYTSVNPLSTTAEKLPTMTFGRCQYHDGQGFYFCVDNTIKKPNITYLKCITRVNCRARATLVDGKVTMIVNTKHNHKPDMNHRDICHFSQALKKRARDEDTPISVIYQEEAKRYPKAAAILREDRLKRKLTSIRRYVRREMNAQAEEEEFEDGLTCNYQLPHVASESFTGKTRDVYHDGRGYYYHETFATDKLRYLMCCEAHCLAQAKKDRREGAPIVEEVGTPSHCHAPDPLRRHCLMLVDNIKRRAAQRSITFETLYQQETAKEPIVAAQIPKEYLLDLVQNIRSKKKGADPKGKFQDVSEEDSLWTFSEPCERLPSEYGWMYHDGKGYFYYCHDTDKSSDRKILRCCEDGCNATAWLEHLCVVRAPGSVLHNHIPEPRRSSMLLLLHKVATRAHLEKISVADIFAEEAKLEPDGAALIPKNKLNETLNNLTVSRYFKELEEEEESQKENTSEDFCPDSAVSLVPCEMLHAANSGKPVYHNFKGHYFTDLLKTSDKQFVKCLMPLCEARGYVDLGDPWNLHIPMSWAEHNHKPDRLYRNRLVFIHSLRQRVLNEDSPVDIIYSEECEREPVGADLVSEDSIKNLMYKIRKSKSVRDDIGEFPYKDYSNSPKDVGEMNVENIFEPFIEIQNDFEQDSETNEEKEQNEEKERNEEQNGGHHKQKPFKPALTPVKVETAEDDNEYTEEEYLEEERLEEDLITENSSVANETSVQTDDVYLPTEKLPTRNNKTIYYNGQGYYFHFNAYGDNVMYLRCTEPKCQVRGVKSTDREDAPIIPTKDCVIHNHQPDFNRRTQLLFINHCKLRAATEINLTINEIWQSEVARDTETASHFSAHNVKVQMKRCRLEHAANTDILTSGETPQENAEDGITFHDASITDPVTENESHEDIHKRAIPEKIPSLLLEPLWHAAGYYYSAYDMSPTLEKVKCVGKECVARAQITLGDRGQPLSITLNKNSAHCHPELPHIRDQLLFIDRCKKRAATTLQSVEEIYYDEAAKVPQVASQLSAVRVKKAMGVAKKEKLKKGMKVDSKESEDSSGDHGMSELGEMANIVTTSTPAGLKEEAGMLDSEETLADIEDDLWTVDVLSLSGEEKIVRKKALARERQRRRRNRMVEDPNKWEQLEREKEMTRQRALAYQREKKARLMEEQEQKTQNTGYSELKKLPKLGPKFLKEFVKPEEEDEFEEEEELVDQTYSDYVTLEEDFDSSDKAFKTEVEEATEENNANTSQTEEDFQLVGHTVT